MVRFQNILQETSLDGVDHKIVAQYFDGIAKWIEGNLNPNAGIILKLIKENPNLKNGILNNMRDFYGKESVSLYRGLSLNSGAIKKYFPNAKVGATYNIKSYDKRTLFSWTENYQVANGWSLSGNGKWGIVLFAKVPIDLFIYSSKEYVKNEMYYNNLLINGRHKGVANAMNKWSETYEDQYEVIVNHENPIECEIIEMHGHD